jgi:tetratricopeptide (TPR) repeat protein
MKADRDKYLSAKRKAAEMAEQWLKVNPSDLGVKSDLAGYYGELGEVDKSRAFLDEFGMDPDPEVSSQISFQVGAAWEVIGNRSAALAWIGDALAKGYALNEVTEYPGLDALRSDPAFVRIMKALPSDSTRTQ